MKNTPKKSFSLSNLTVSLIGFAFLLTLSSCSQTPEGLLQDKCTKCHNLAPVCAKLQVYNEAQWVSSIEKMAKLGASVSEPQIKQLATYLAKQTPSGSAFCK